MMRHLSDRDIINLVEEIALASDRKFFDQHPQRNYRIRPAWEFEVENFSRACGYRAQAPEGHCWWTLVHRFGRGVRGRLLFTASHELSPHGTPEATARSLWDALCPPKHKRGLRAFQRELAKKRDAS
jgi:hypothetical protein